jgi:hypothetical protein
MAEAHTNKGQQQGTQGNAGTANKGQQGTQGTHQGTQQNQGNANKGGQQQQGGQGQGQGGGMGHYVKDAAKSAQQTAGNLVSQASDQAEHAATAVAGGMRTLAGSIREHSPSQGMLHSAADSVAGTLESGGRYLEEEGLRGMVDDMAGMVRRNPVACMCVCIGVGFVLGRMMTSSSRSY